MFLVRFAPLASVLLFFGVAAVWRAVHQRRRFGALGVHVFRERGAALPDLTLLVGGLGFFGQALAWAVEPAWIAPLLAFGPSFALTVAASAFVFLALGLVVASQLDLGASWRIGIDPDAAPGLVTHGFYRFTRNPIFAFMLLAIVGFALALPTWLSFVLAACSWAAVRAQVGREEAYLLVTYGDAYRTYRARVGRFLPGLGTVAV